MTERTPALRLALSRERLRTALAERPQVQDEALHALQGLSQRHPLGVALGAAAAGALLMLLRPWRVPGLASFVVTELPRVVAAMLSAMKDPPWSEWLAACRPAAAPAPEKPEPP